MLVIHYNLKDDGRPFNSRWDTTTLADWMDDWRDQTVTSAEYLLPPANSESPPPFTFNVPSVSPPPPIMIEAPALLSPQPPSYTEEPVVITTTPGEALAALLPLQEEVSPGPSDYDADISANPIRAGTPYPHFDHVSPTTVWPPYINYTPNMYDPDFTTN